MANRVDPDETPRSAASHLGLHCLLRLVCPNTDSKYGNVVGYGQDIPYPYTEVLKAVQYIDGRRRPCSDCADAHSYMDIRSSHVV